MSAAGHCVICKRPSVAAVNAAVLNGDSLLSIAAKFAVNYHTLRRHSRKCLVEQCSQELIQRHDITQESLSSSVESLRSRTLDILDKAESDGNLGRRDALLAIRESTRLIELQHKLIGELQSGNHVDIERHPDWMHIKADIIKVLRLHPLALADLRARWEERRSRIMPPSHMLLHRVPAARAIPPTGGADGMGD